MKNKLLVIFFIAIFFSILIYFCFKKENNKILLLGEYSNINNINRENVTTFLYDNITYKELINAIKNNDYIIVKNKKVYLNQLINSSSKIIIFANNNEYIKRCNKNNDKYLITLEKYKNNLRKIISKISNAEVIFISNSCDLKNNDYVELISLT